MKLSIIIPVYNVENTVRRCIDSVLGDSYSDLQIVLVDDGSTDASCIICDEYALNYSFIQVIHKQNAGLSSARNAGIEKAEGQYLTFIDSDDYIEKDSIYKLMGIILSHPEYDMLEYPIYERYGNSRIQRKTQWKDHVYNNASQYWFKTKAYEHAYAWNKIYKKEIFINCRYEIGKVFEDVYILPLLLLNCRKIATTTCGLYYYCYNKKGITVNAGLSGLEDLFEAHSRLVGTIFSPLLSVRYYAHVLNIQLDIFELSGKVPLLPSFESHYRPFKTKVILSKILGVKRLCQLNRMIHRIYRHSH